MTALGLLGEELGVHERTLRRALNQGTLHGARPTPRTLDLPLSERQYIRRSWSLLSVLREALRTEQNVRFALLFGSSATGAATSTSDVDVLVDLRDASLERIVDLSAKLTAILGRPVDVIRLQDAGVDPLFLADVVAEGRVLVDREKLWPRLRACESLGPPRPPATSAVHPGGTGGHRPSVRHLGMADRPARKADRNRWQRDIVRHLEDLPRQYAALETAMAGFGEDFDLRRFKKAFETTQDMEAYNRVQALERAVGRVQNYLAVLAEAGMRLAALPRPPIGPDGSPAQQAFEALRDAEVIDGALCRRLIRAQRARSMIEHSYVQTPAGDVHRAAELVHDAAQAFLGPYRRWIDAYLAEP